MTYPTDGAHVLAYQRPGAVDAHALFGTPRQVASGLAELEQTGVTYVLLVPEANSAQLHRFCDDVIPCYRDRRWRQRLRGLESAVRCPVDDPGRD